MIDVDLFGLIRIAAQIVAIIVLIILAQRLVRIGKSVADFANDSAKDAKQAAGNAREALEITDGIATQSQTLLPELRSLIETTDQLNKALDQQRKRQEEDFIQLRDGHAIASVERNLTYIVEEKLGFRDFVKCSDTALILLASVATENEIPNQEVQQLKHTDMLLHAHNKNGKPRYIAIQVSYTVHHDDVRKTSNIAKLIERFTDIETIPLVAGVTIHELAKKHASELNVDVYTLPNRHLTPGPILGANP